MQGGGFNSEGDLTAAGGIIINVSDESNTYLYVGGTITVGSVGGDHVDIVLNILTQDVSKIEKVIKSNTIQTLCPANVAIHIYSEEAYNNVTTSVLKISDMIVVNNQQINSPSLTVKTDVFKSPSDTAATHSFSQNGDNGSWAYIIPDARKNDPIPGIIYSQNANFAVLKSTIMSALAEQPVLDFERKNKCFYKALYNKINVNENASRVGYDGYGTLIGVQKCIDDIDFALWAGTMYGYSQVNVVMASTDVSFPCDSESFFGTSAVKYYFNDRAFFYSLSGVLYSRFKNYLTGVNASLNSTLKNDWWYFSESLGVGYILHGETADVGFITALKFDYARSPSGSGTMGGVLAKCDKLDGKFLFYDVNCSLMMKNLFLGCNLSLSFGTEIEICKNITNSSIISNGDTQLFKFNSDSGNVCFSRILIEKQLSKDANFSLGCGEIWTSDTKNLTASAGMTFEF